MLWCAWGLLIGTAGMAAAAPPTIGSLNDRTAFTGTIGPILVTIGDDATAADDLTISATSSNQAVVSDGQIQYFGSGTTRALFLGSVLTAGTTTITVSVSDGTETATTAFELGVLDKLVSYLAEGATGEFFDTDIVIAASIKCGDLFPVTVTFFKEDGTTQVLGPNLMLTGEPLSIHVDEIPGMEATSFSAKVDSQCRELIVERTMRWGAGGYGAHTERATSQPALDWLFAEGSQGFFFTYFLLVNPQTTANTAHVTYLREGAPPVVRDYPLLPSSRRTIYAGDDAALVNTSFGARIHFDQPGMAERAMYFGTTPLFTGGHDSAGATRPSREWFLAEGATGSYFSTFVLIANPDDEPTDVTLTYLPATGAAVVKQVTIPPGQRVTRNIATEDATLSDAAVGVRVQATRPIIVERSQYWPNPAATWSEAHNSFGVTVAGQRWGLAEGRVGGPRNAQTYILLANPGATAATAQVTFLARDYIAHPLIKTLTIPPASRLNVAVTGPQSDVPELANQAFGALVDATEPIVVERSLYEDVDGVTWAAGTNATATPLPARPPLAYVSPDLVNVAVGTNVRLTSVPPLAEPDFSLTYIWTFRSKPAASQAVLTDADTPACRFTVDVPGDYLVQLVVSNGFLKSAPETVLVSTARPPVDVTVTATDNTAHESGDTGTIVFTRTGGDLTTPLTMPFTFAFASTPTPGEDFQDFGQHSPSPFATFYDRTITIPANQTSVTVTVTPIDDALVEDLETVIVTLTPGRDYVVVGGPASIPLIDNEPTGVSVISVPSPVFESDGTTVALKFVRVGGDPSVELHVSIEVTGTATEGVDYTPIVKTVVFPANQTHVDVMLTVLADGMDEGPETVVTRILPGTGYVPGGRPTDTLDIIDHH